MERGNRDPDVKRETQVDAPLGSEYRSRVKGRIGLY